MSTQPIKRGDSWFVQIRRKGHKSISKSFPTKTLAVEWARRIEREMDTTDFNDDRGLSKVTVGQIIERYEKEIGAVKRFGRSKVFVLRQLHDRLGGMLVSSLTADRLIEHCYQRNKEGAGGVTIAVELAYLGSVYKCARQLWKIPVNCEIISDVRANLRYAGLASKSKERDRRPTDEEIEKICAFFVAKGGRQRVPMPDLIRFAIASAMRAGEIIGLLWEDLNEKDKTIIIRNRKHPQEKQGNDQEVPLLGDAFDIVMRQPRVDKRIFPWADGTLSSLFPRACQAVGVEDLRFHDLRHEGVSRLFEQGYRIEQVALVSGHRDWHMLRRYTQIRAKDLHRG